MKLIGAGLGRTGTSSLVVALRELGFTPYHMQEGVFQTPGQRERWDSYISASEAGDKSRAKEALEQLVNSMVQEGFDATTDYPACLIYKQLMEKFPNAKVILTKRESGEKWAESVNATIGRGYKLTMDKDAGNGGAKRRSRLSSITKYIWERTPFVEADPDNSLNATSLAKAHDNWVKEVIEYVPKERLLVFEAQMGWIPLCEFLGVPIPDKPYPRTNTREVLSSVFDRLEGKLSNTSKI